MPDLNQTENKFDFISGSEEIYKDLFDNAHDLIHFSKPDGSLMYVNNAWIKSLKYSNEEINRKSIYDLVDEEDKEEFLQYRTAVLRGTNEQKQVIVRLLAKTGETIIVEGNISAKFKGDEPLYTRAIFRNITLRVQYEEDLKLINHQLKQEQENLQQVIQSAPDAIIVIDENSRVTLWNPKAEELFGWKEHEVLNSSLSDKIIPLQHRDGHQKGMKRYLSTGEAHVLNRTIEISAINNQEQEFYISLTISSFKIGSQTAFISFIRNIDQEKKDRMELERKTIELERSNVNLEEFAFAASHDLKEPIRKVQILCDRLKNELEPHLAEEEKRIFERIDRANQRMKLLVDDLLEYAHVNLNELQKQEIDLNDKVMKVLEDLELVIEEKHAQVTVEKLPVIKGHRRQIQQLFYNVIGNALKYSKPGVIPTIHITAKIVSADTAGSNLTAANDKDKYHLIEVSDNGIGFDQKYADNIFGIFKRLQNKAEYNGSGLGLAIARKVVYNHNGTMWAESRVGEGARFKILLPV
jgi:two-component system sensor kinase FixL